MGQAVFVNNWKKTNRTQTDVYSP